MHRLHALSVAVALACAGAAVPARGQATPAPDPAPADSLTLDEAQRLARGSRYFALRDRLAGAAGRDTPALLFARAVAAHAFNRPAESNRAAAAALRAGGLPDSTRTRLRLLELRNHLRLKEYAAGLAAADALLREDAAVLDGEPREEAETLGRIFRAVADVPPQRVAARGELTLALEGGRIPVTVGDSARSYVFDTGANLSTMMRSEARALGLRIRPAGIEVGTGTERKVTADLAVAGRVRIGSVELRDVLFLVLDDSMLTFPGGLTIPGIVGFPVIEALGEVRVGRGGALHVPARAPARGLGNLALDGLTPLTLASWRGQPVLCALDTGANDTVLYEPFYRRNRAWVDSAGERRTRRWAGAGGAQEMEVRSLAGAELSVGGARVTLPRLDVLPRSIADSEEENVRDCNLGHDVLDAFPEYVLNFRDMSFLLR